MKRISYWLSLVTLLVLASCGTDTTVQYEWDALLDTTESGQDLPWSWDTIPGVDSPWKDPPDDEDRYQIILLHDTTTPLNAFVEQKTPIRAKVIDYKLGKPAVGLAVRYEIVGSDPLCDTGSPCAQFLVKEGMTDQDGLVSVTFDSGTEGGVLYDILLSGENSIADGMQVHVKDFPTGTLRVNIEYDGPIPIHGINVRLMHGNYTCTQFNPVTPWVEDLDGQKTVSGPGSKPTFENLLVSQKFLLFATAKGPSDGLSAAGCVDAIHVLPLDEAGVTDLTLKVHVLTLNPAGTYDTVNHFDFTGAIPGQVGEIINLVVDLFYNPGAIIIDLVKELVSQYIGSWVTDIAFSLFEDALADIITDWLLNNSPGFIQDFFQIGQDLVQIVKNLELTSELKISKLSNDYYIQGIQAWHGITLYWKLGCDPDDPDYAECGKDPFTLQDLSDSDVPIDLITGQFTGMIANWDNLIIDTHNINLNYGKLVLFVINEMLLPAISDYNSIEDLLYSIVDCHSVAQGFVGDVLGAVGVDEDDVEGFCNTAVGFIVSPIEEIIGGLTLDSKLRIHGKCTIRDIDDDLYVDQMLDGQWWGHVEIQSEEGSEFVGDFAAEKANQNW